VFRYFWCFFLNTFWAVCL